MSQATCPFCKRPAAGTYCTWCHVRLGPPPSVVDYKPAPGAARFLNGKVLALGGAFIVCVAVVALYITGAVSFFGGPDYAKVIQKSEIFGKPLTVEVNRRPLRHSSDAGGDTQTYAVGAAYVLEGLGLLEIDAYTNEHSYSGEFLPGRYGRGMTYTTKHVGSITLTESGMREAVDWEEYEPSTAWEVAGRPDQTKNHPWWRVPIGEREFVRLVSVTEVKRENGRDGANVVFEWRWHPNYIGEAFNTGSEVQESLRGEAREIAKRLGVNSKALFRATAKLERDGRAWKVVGIDDDGESNWPGPWRY